MTLMDVINRIDSLKPNRYNQDEKIMWLSTLDERIMNDIIATHEEAEAESFNGYTSETSLTTELLVFSPYDEVYLYWLEAQIDYWNGEYAKYNNSIAMFNAAYTAFEKHYNKTHLPKRKTFKFF